MIEPEKPKIKIDDFFKVDIRMGTVLQATRAEGSDKLLKLQIDFGTEKRQILTAMAPYFSPEHFIGKQIMAIINVDIKKMRGHESHGIIIAAENADGSPTLLHPEKEVPNGSRVI